MRISDWSSDVCSSDLIVGDIEDEHDVEEDSYIRPLPSGDFLVKALTPIDSFNEYFGSAFPDDEFDTVAGLVMSTFGHRSEEHTSELQSLMRISYAVCCLKKQNSHNQQNNKNHKQN